MINRVLVVLVLLASCTHAVTTHRSLAVGDGQIDGRKIAPYEFTWRQCALADGTWTTSPDLTEQVALVGEQVLRLRQTALQPSGATTVSTSYYDRASLAPLRLEFEARLPDGQVRPLAMQELNASGYRGWSALGGQMQEVQGEISSKMLNGASMGLPLALLGPQTEAVEFLASMMNFDATYRVIATWGGTEMLEHDGRKVEAMLVDIEWHHRESGDVYAPGPDGSGGRYWVVANPPAGFPYVPRYKTDSFAVEFVPGTCPPGEE